MWLDSGEFNYSVWGSLIGWLNVWGSLIGWLNKHCSVWGFLSNWLIECTHCYGSFISLSYHIGLLLVCLLQCTLSSISGTCVALILLNIIYLHLTLLLLFFFFLFSYPISSVSPSHRMTINIL